MKIKLAVLGLLLVLVGCSSTIDNVVIDENSSEVVQVPFSSQAPDGDWSEPWQNACEETSVIMINNFYEDDTEIDIEEARKEILEVFETKRSQIQVSKDESIETIKDLINALDLNWKAKVKSDPTVEDLINELQKQRPIIAPIYAPEIENPFYAEGGPDYHVVVIVGYDESKQVFIINDPGTQYGEKLEFSYDVVMDAVHDLNQADYDAGEKRVLFTEGV